MLIILPLIALFVPSVIGYSDTSKTIYETLHTLSLVSLEITKKTLIKSHFLAIV